MAVFNPNNELTTKINQGNKFNDGDSVSSNDINAVVEGAGEAWDIAKSANANSEIAKADAYMVKSLATNAPNVDEANNVGVPKVEIEPVGDGYRFVFKNLKGEQGEYGADVVDDKIKRNSKRIDNLEYALSQSGSIQKVELSQRYSVRETANGENIIDEQYAFVDKIEGNTVFDKTTGEAKNSYISSIKSVGNKLFDDSGLIGKKLGTSLISTQFPFRISEGTYSIIIKLKNNSSLQIKNVVSFSLVEQVGGESIVSMLSSSNNAVNTVATFNVTNEQAKKIKYCSFYFNSDTGSQLIGDEINYVMLNRGYNILPNENYKESVLSFNGSQELREYDYILPQEKKKIFQTTVVTFTGNETFEELTNADFPDKCALAFNAPHERYNETWGYGISNWFAEPTADIFTSWTNATKNTFKVQNGKIYLIFVGYSIGNAKSYLKSLYNNGNPLIVAYKDNSSIENILNNSLSYTAVKGGLEIIEGNQNESYGARNKITQSYFTEIE